MVGCQDVHCAAIPPATVPAGNSEETFVWNLNCVRMASDGTVIGELECTFEGILQHSGNEPDNLYCKLETPDDYPYSIPNINNSTTDTRTTHFDGCEYFASSIYGYSKDENAPKLCNFALDADNKYLIVRWYDTTEYLVCFADPAADAQNVFAHFETFRQICDRNLKAALSYE